MPRRNEMGGLVLDPHERVAVALCSMSELELPDWETMPQLCEDAYQDVSNELDELTQELRSRAINIIGSADGLNALMEEIRA